MPRAQRTFAADPRNVAASRGFLRATLGGWGAGDLEYVAAQALSELTTNAVIHARTDFDVMLEWAGEVLWVGVHDRSPKLPLQRRYTAEAATGRGLRLVSRLCRSWGIEETADGKTVWCEIVLDATGDRAEAELDAFLALDDVIGHRSTGVGGVARLQAAG